MPTGITYGIDKDDVDFTAFAQRCMRSFGALVHLRDEPNAPIAPRPPETYYADALVESQAEMNRLGGMDKDAIHTAHKEYVAEKEVYNKTYQAKQHEIKSRYLAMKEKVNRWTPPEPASDYAAVKKMMKDQLDMCLQQDFNITPDTIEYDEHIWFDTQVDCATNTLKIHTEQYAKELAINEKRTKNGCWVTKMLESLEAYNNGEPEGVTDE